MTRSFVLVLVAASMAGCRSMAPPSTARPAETPLEIRWSRTAAEHHAVFEQTYRLAGEHLRAAADTLRGDWGVILDGDETVLDNSLYQRERAALSLAYSPESWAEWVHREAAPALPGAVAFTHLVQSLGGRVVIVTNRNDATCSETRANLAAIGVDAAAVLCQVGAESDKGPRFAAVQSGAVPGLPALTVAMWVGDNIQDFPGLTQQAWQSASGEFGSRYWVFPNPMYGSWPRNPDL